jgi:glutaryl-CoA dehydrogenase
MGFVAEKDFNGLTAPKI